MLFIVLDSFLRSKYSKNIYILRSIYVWYRLFFKLLKVPNVPLFWAESNKTFNIFNEMALKNIKITDKRINFCTKICLSPSFYECSKNAQKI